ncbi:MAG: hypothetical protein RJS97_08730 [Parvibaculaceae bacterium]
MSDTQRAALLEFVNRIHELLAMCAHGGVPIEADVYVENHLTPGRILAVARLFQEREDDMPDAQPGVIRFPGSVVWDCNPFVQELVRSWVLCQIGEASASDTVFLTPKQEADRKFALRRLREYVAALEQVLQSPEWNESSNPTETTREPQPSGTKKAVLRNWAFGYDAAGQKWYLFHRNKDRWERPSRAKIQGGRPEDFLKLFAENNGRLDRASVDAWMKTHAPRVRIDQRRKSVNVELCRLRRSLRRAIADAARFQTENMGNVLPFDEDRDVWIAEVEIGYALPDDSGCLEFKRKQDLLKD